MLWREPYQPRVLLDVALPFVPLATASQPAGIFLGAFDLRAQRELGVWLRLLNDAGLADSCRILLIGPKSMVDAAESVFPPSLQPRLLGVQDADGAWRKIVSPDMHERSFAMALVGGLARILVVGAPTEEVWDQFQAIVRQTQPLER